MRKRSIWHASLILLLAGGAGLYPLLSQATPTQSGAIASASATLSPQDRAKFNRVLLSAKQQQLASQSFGQIVQTIAQQFLGATYQDGLLNQTPTEQLFLSLQKFDCVLLVETVVALARNVMRQDPAEQTFAQNVETQRYRAGKLEGYCSRLHYFSDWIADNERRGLVKNLTAPLGGVPLPHKLNFMTQHRSSYPQLKSDQEFRCLQQVEATLAKTIALTYIPTAKIRGIYPKLQSGDVIAVATSVPGLDVTHTGLLERSSQGAVGLIHASPGGVVKRAVDLQTYVSRVDAAVGIMVARPGMIP
jgi:hypothetical protein